MNVQSMPKPKHKHRVPRAQGNPIPTINDICRYCGSPYSSTHEIYEGFGRRQVSIRNKMQIKVCDFTHRIIHMNKSLDKALKRRFQREFERGRSREEFIKLMGRNYL